MTLPQKCAASPTLRILLVEDNPADVELTMEAFEASDGDNEVHAVRDGVEALDYLLGRGKYVGALRPNLVLLDLNLPRMNGREVLSAIKSDPDLRSIPVLMLTTSSAPRDVQAAYDMHVNCYIIKPINLDEFTEMVDTIERFWSTVARLA